MNAIRRGPRDMTLKAKDWRERLLLSIAEEMERHANSKLSVSPELLARWARRIRKRLHEGRGN